MKPHRLSLLAIVMTLAGTLLSGESAGQPPEVKPGPEHALLKQLEGTWDATMKIYPARGQAAIESTGVERNRVACGGLWVITDIRSTLMGQEFHGHGVIGYDTAKKKYVGTWVDSMQPYIGLSEGSFDSTGKVRTMMMEAPDMTGKLTKFKMVEEIKGPDSRVFTMSTPGSDGKDFVNMVITYKRRTR